MRTVFEIHPLGIDRAVVRLFVEDALYATQVLAVEASDLRALSGFFDELARDWRGWSASKVWKLADERASLEARHDGAGHVTIVARLFPRDFDDDWQANATLLFEPGQLDSVALAVREDVYARP